MPPRGELRKPPVPRRGKSSLSNISDDVLFEILLNFVSIDLDGGPFTLTLVCTRWKSFVISKPRIWTYILVDQSQTEWYERLEVAAYLSKGLPLQLHLWVPFTSDIPISQIVSRCAVLIVDSLYLYYSGPPERWRMKTIVLYDTFRKHRAAFKGIGESIIHFLRDVHTDLLRIRSEDPNYACFADSAYGVYEKVIAGNSVGASLETVHPISITALVFKHADGVMDRGIRFEMGELWSLLPNMRHLSLLELYDDFVRLDKRTVLLNIRLPCLLSLTIHCSILSQLPYSFTNDIWMGLLGILRSLDAPIIETMVLYGSVQRIKTIMTQATTRPADLTLFIRTFDKRVDESRFGRQWIWHETHHITIVLPENKQAFSRLTMPGDLLFEMQSLLALLPKESTKRLWGNDELLSILQSDTLGIEKFDIHYACHHAVVPVLVARRVSSLVLQTGRSQLFPGPRLRELLENVDYVYFEDHQSVRDAFYSVAFYSPHSTPTELPMKLWDSHTFDPSFLPN